MGSITVHNFYGETCGETESTQAPNGYSFGEPCFSSCLKSEWLQKFAKPSCSTAHFLCTVLTHSGKYI